jgi:hypothetical protein
MSVVKRKKNPESAASILEKSDVEEPEVKNHSLLMTSDKLLENIEAICDFLESREINVLQYFKNSELRKDGSTPIQGVKQNSQISLRCLTKLLD